MNYKEGKKVPHRDTTPDGAHLYFRNCCIDNSCLELISNKGDYP